MKTKYKIGDIVHRAYTTIISKSHDCPDCLGSQEWTATSPAGESYKFACPRCSGSYQSNPDMNLNYNWHSPCSDALTIGSVRTDTHDVRPISYMCQETGVGSGSVYYEGTLFSNEEDALKAATEMCLEMNQKDEGIINQYNETLRLSDYQFSKIQTNAKK